MKTGVLLFVLLTATVLRAQSDTTIQVYFDNNVFVLTEAQQNTLAAYKVNTVCVISYKGYADTVGTIQNNKLLAQKRVAQVAAVFAGVADCNTGNQLAAGETTDFGTALQDNRKVEVKLRLKPPVTEVVATPSEIITTINYFNIRFLPDRAELDPASAPYLDQLYNELNSYPAAHFEIVGHINLQGKKIRENDRFYKLSQDRAKLVAGLLEARGITPDRLRYKGVGNHQPLHPNPANEQQKRENMRVEVKILK